MALIKGTHQIRTRLCSSQNSMAIRLSFNIPDKNLGYKKKAKGKNNLREIGKTS